LRLDTELILKAAGNIAEAAVTIRLSIWSMSNAIEHMSGREHQYRNLYLTDFQLRYTKLTTAQVFLLLTIVLT
jgi:hypothetical protein